MKTKVVVFNRSGARLFINPVNLAELVQNGALVNPDLSLVKGIPPHCWKRQGHKVVPNPKETSKFYAADNVDVKPVQGISKYAKWLFDVFKINY